MSTSNALSEALGRIFQVIEQKKGYPWTIIQVSYRNAYFQSLEKASVDGNILPFTQFVLTQMNLL
jgi:hypothetical protein